MGSLISRLGGLFGSSGNSAPQNIRVNDYLPEELVHNDDAMRRLVQTIDISKLVGSDEYKQFPKTWSPQEALNHYTRWTFVCSSVIAEAAMMVPLQVVRVGDGAEEIDEEHALNDLIEEVNPLMTRQEFVFMALADCLVTGRSYWQLARNSLGQPAELWPVIGEMKPQFRNGESGPVLDGWRNRYQAEGTVKDQRIEADDVIYLRIPKPGTVFGSMGTGQAASGIVSVEEQLTEAQWRIFRQGMHPSLILLMKSDSFKDPKKREQFVQQASDKHAGVTRQGGVMGLPGSVEPYEPKRPNELAFAKSAELVRDNILAMYRVPGALVGLSKDVNRASAEALQWSFAQFRLKPLLQMVESRLNQDLAMREFAEDGVRLRFNDPTPQNEEEERALMESDLQNAVRTVNEVRAERGLPEVPWGEVPLQPLNVAPLGSAPPVPEGEEEDEQTAPARQTLAEGDGWNERERARMGNIALRRKTDFMVRYAGAYRDALSDLERRVLDAWDLAGNQGMQLISQQLPGPVNRELDPEQFAEEVAEKTAKLNQRGAYLGGDLQGELMGFSPDPNNPWTATSEEVRAEAAKYNAAHFSDPAQTVRRAMAETVEGGITGNKTFDEIKSDIVNTFGTMKESQATRVAMTETTRLFNGGGQRFRDKYGIEDKQWVCSFVNSRETHQAADGQVVGNNEDFVVGSGRGPYPGALGVAEEDVNCACVSIGVPPERVRR